MAGLLSRFFGFRERSTDLATEVRAGVTTCMVMAYIIFVNPVILGFTGVPGLDGKELPFAATLTVTCLTAGLLSIAMGLASNYPFALSAGMGLNACWMPFTWSITNGIGAGFVPYTAIKLLRGRGRQLSWMVYLACAAFIVYFWLPLLEGPAQ
jgi:xanthine/uracil/vitamin C permease (AzgA family)